MKIYNHADDSRTLKGRGLKSLFDTEVNIKVRVLTIIALAGAIGNTLGFLANLFLYGFNYITSFCAVCAIVVVLYLFAGSQSKHSIGYGYAMLALLNVFEFPLLTLAYGAVMFPYLLIGFHAMVMISEKTRRIYLIVILGIYDLFIVVYSIINPYIFGPVEAAGLLGSGVVTFAISVITVASLVIMWQNVYLADTIEIDAITKTQSQIGFIKKATNILQNDYSRDYILMYFNVFSFKAINSIYGIEGGNRFLAAVAKHLIKSPISPRLIGRLNADRFVCLVDKRNLKISELSSVCQLTFEENGRSLMANLHCGIFDINDRSLSVDSMIDRASTAIRFVHNAGNKHYAFYDKKSEATYNEETIILGEIDKAINEDQFHPYYQPIVDCKTREIVSAEAVARWISPMMGVISPGVFIPVLEKKNLVSNLDRIIAKSVYDFVQDRLDNNKNVVPISVNLSRDDLFDETMVKEINDIIKGATKYIRPRFEITESTYENITEHMLKVLSEFRKNGAEIMVDDFGSGFSSLGMITDYEFDVIKLDIIFSRKITDNEKIVGVVKSIVDMSHNLGAKVVAEGVETEEQFNAIRDCGCDYVQGYLFYKPLPENEFAKLID